MSHTKKVIECDNGIVYLNKQTKKKHFKILIKLILHLRFLQEGALWVLDR